MFCFFSNAYFCDRQKLKHNCWATGKLMHGFEMFYKLKYRYSVIDLTVTGRCTEVWTLALYVLAFSNINTELFGHSFSAKPILVRLHGHGKLMNNNFQVLSEILNWTWVNQRHICFYLNHYVIALSLYLGMLSPWKINLFSQFQVFCSHQQIFFQCLSSLPPINWPASCSLLIKACPRYDAATTLFYVMGCSSC